MLIPGYGISLSSQSDVSQSGDQLISSGRAVAGPSDLSSLFLNPYLIESCIKGSRSGSLDLSKRMVILNTENWSNRLVFLFLFLIQWRQG
jgi:hypothetical protein